MFSVPISVKNKKEMIDMFETLAHFPDTVMMLRNGDNTVDAHSLMGFFAIDEKIPIELLLESELDVYGAICGKAIYTGSLDLKQAIEVTNKI